MRADGRARYDGGGRCAARSAGGDKARQAACVSHHPRCIRQPKHGGCWIRGCEKGAVRWRVADPTRALAAGGTTSVWSVVWRRRWAGGRLCGVSWPRIAFVPPLVPVVPDASAHGSHAWTGLATRIVPCACAQVVTTEPSTWFALANSPEARRNGEVRRLLQSSAARLLNLHDYLFSVFTRVTRGNGGGGEGEAKGVEAGGGDGDLETGAGPRLELRYGEAVAWFRPFGGGACRCSA